MVKHLVSFLLLILIMQTEITANTVVVASIAELQKAINTANPGDIIFLKKGVYTASSDIQIDKAGTKSHPITIAAEETGATEITGSGGFNLISPASYIIIHGFKFTHAASKARMGGGTSFCQ